MDNAKENYRSLNGRIIAIAQCCGKIAAEAGNRKHDLNYKSAADFLIEGVADRRDYRNERIWQHVLVEYTSLIKSL